MSDIAEKARQNVLRHTASEAASYTKNQKTVEGYSFQEALKNGEIDYEKLFKSYATTGFQASSLSRACEIIREMLNKRVQTPEGEKKCTIFFGYTSNMISCGVREMICFLAQHKLIDCIVTTAGGIEEDFIKCIAPHYMGSFTEQGAGLRDGGVNRIGNLLVPNEHYCKFEDWMMPIMDELLIEQKEKGLNLTPSKLIRRLGEKINDPRSVYYWCAKNDIPVFCPAITDGSIGDMVFFHSYKNGSLVLDIAEDIKAINKIAINAANSAMLVLGGGIVKHHICNANLMRNGVDYAVYINTGAEFDGSDAGASPDEAVSWGKIKPTAPYVKVFADASLVFPIVMTQTFFPYAKAQQEAAAKSAAKK